MKTYSEDVLGRIIDRDSRISKAILVSNGADSYGVSQSKILAKVAHANVDRQKEIITTSSMWSIRTGIPFSEALLGHIMNEEIELASDLSGLVRHNGMSEIYRLDREDWMRESREALRLNRSRKMIAVSSKVISLGGKIRHIPMLDLRIPVGSTGKASAISILKEIGQSGYLINSGKSFHFYGSESVTQKRFMKMLGMALLFSPLVDVPWIAHQLIEGAAALRLSSKIGYKHRPYLVGEIG